MEGALPVSLLKICTQSRLLNALRAGWSSVAGHGSLGVLNGGVALGSAGTGSCSSSESRCLKTSSNVVVNDMLTFGNIRGNVLKMRGSFLPVIANQMVSNRNVQ